MCPVATITVATCLNLGYTYVMWMAYDVFFMLFAECCCCSCIDTWNELPMSVGLSSCPDAGSACWSGTRADTAAAEDSAADASKAGRTVVQCRVSARLCSSASSTRCAHRHGSRRQLGHVRHAEHILLHRYIHTNLYSTKNRENESEVLKRIWGAVFFLCS